MPLTDSIQNEKFDAAKIEILIGSQTSSHYKMVISFGPQHLPLAVMFISLNIKQIPKK